MMNYGGMNTGWIVFCMAAVVAIIALIVWAIMRAGTQTSSREDRAIPRGDALETLERRFAKGEIDGPGVQTPTRPAPAALIGLMIAWTGMMTIATRIQRGDEQ